MAKKLNAHIHDREANDHYVEEFWCSERLLQEEAFPTPVLDPCCGWGRIVQSSQRYFSGRTIASDIIDRSKCCSVHEFHQHDFLAGDMPDWMRDARSIIANPPFNLIREFAERAMSLHFEKVAFIFPLRRLPAATWLRNTPHLRTYYMNPRPSMPTGDFILRAQRGECDPKTGKPLKVGGGTQDFCWVIWERGYVGEARERWLLRDKRSSASNELGACA